MARPVRNTDELHTYAVGVMMRALCHAPNVNMIAPALFGYVLWRAKPNSLEVKTYQGKMANVIWFETDRGNYSCRYALVYNHHTQEIEIRSRTQVGPALHSFSNASTLAQVFGVFSGL